MHIVTDTEESAPAPTSTLKLMTSSETNGLPWVAYRRRPSSGDADSFFFIVTTPAPEARAIHTSDDFDTAPKAERAAREWCTAYVAPTAAQGSNELAAFEGEPLPAAPPRDEIFVAGWLIMFDEGRGGTIDATAVDPDGVVGEEFKGYETRALAEADARTWAEAHPFVIHDEGGDEPNLDADEAEVSSSDQPPADVAAAAAAPTADPPAPEPTPTPTPAPATPVAALLREEGYEPDQSRDWSTVDEVWTLLSERDSISDRLAIAEAAKARAAAQAKEISKQLEECDTKIRVARNNAERQRVLPLHPAPRTFAGSEATRAKIGADAAQVAARLTWAFNGVEHRVCHESVAGADGPRFTAWLDGHRDQTEGFGETLDQAVEACKNTASVIFANADPGQTKSSEDKGPVADGPTPAKRGRAAKLKGHDQVAVIAAVESVLTWPEATEILGCSKAQLEAYADKVGINLAKIQGRRAGEEKPLPEAPAEKVRKPRSRRPKGGGK